MLTTPTMCDRADVRCADRRVPQVSSTGMPRKHSHSRTRRNGAFNCTSTGGCPTRAQGRYGVARPKTAVAKRNERTATYRAPTVGRRSKDAPTPHPDLSPYAVGRHRVGSLRRSPMIKPVLVHRPTTTAAHSTDRVAAYRRMERTRNGGRARETARSFGATAERSRAVL